MDNFANLHGTVNHPDEDEEEFVRGALDGTHRYQLGMEFEGKTTSEGFADLEELQMEHSMVEINDNHRNEQIEPRIRGKSAKVQDENEDLEGIFVEIEDESDKEGRVRQKRGSSKDINLLEDTEEMLDQGWIPKQEEKEKVEEGKKKQEALKQELKTTPQKESEDLKQQLAARLRKRIEDKEKERANTKGAAEPQDTDIRDLRQNTNGKEDPT